MPEEACAIASHATRDLSPHLLDECGCLRVVAASLLADTMPRRERIPFWVRNGLYSFPTNELIRLLTRQIASRTAIEIGAGRGALAEALDRRATDNRGTSPS